MKILIILLLLLSSCITNETVTRHYNTRGAYIGKSIESNQSVRYYDQQGKFIETKETNN